MYSYFIITILFSLLSEGDLRCSYDIPHGSVETWCQQFYCNYHCDDGYERNNEVQNVFCSSLGKWQSESGYLTETDFCKAKTQCPDDLSHAVLDLSCNRTRGEYCTYTCDEGWESMSDERTLYCGLDFSWNMSSSALCKKIECPSIIPNGKIDWWCTCQPGSYCNFYSCDSGYEATSSLALRCNETGQWEWNKNLTEKICTVKTHCTHDIPHAILDQSCNRTSGENCSYNCEEGWRPPSDDTTISCGSDLTWNMALSTICTRIMCPSYIPNGYINSYCNTMPGQYCHVYYCNRGYKATLSPMTVKCNASGQWEWSKDQGERMCTAKTQCPDNPSHAILDVSCNRTSGEYCNYTCEEGWEPMSDEMTLYCDSYFAWIMYSSAPCKKIECPSTIPNGYIYSWCTMEAGNYCNDYICDNGYEATIPLTLKCNETGQWEWNKNLTEKLCTAKTHCTHDIPHAILDQSCNRTSGENCNYTCEEGWRPPSDDTTISCGSDFTWNMALSAVCTRIMCPSYIQNGYIGYGCNTLPGAYCSSFYCYSGYKRILSPLTLKCNASGQWEWTKDQVEKLCTAKEQLCPQYIENGRGYVDIDCLRTHGSNCSYNCYSGWIKNPLVSRITCKSDSTWDIDYYVSLCTSTPTTASAYTRCPSTIPNGWINYDCNRFRYSYCGFYCNSGSYATVNDLYCDGTARWMFGDTACKRRATTPSPRCPSTIPNGWINYGCRREMYYYCDFSCNADSYSTASQLYCNSNAKWSSANSACVRRTYTTYSPESNDEELDVGVPITIASIFAVLVLLVIFCAVTCLVRKRQRASNARASVRFTPSAINTASGNTGSSPGVQLFPRSDAAYVGPYSSFQPTTPPDGGMFNQEPPKYSTIAAATNDLPPSYDEVTASPSDFKVV